MSCIDIINGPNLNRLGIRNTEVYGKESLEDIERRCKTEFPAHELVFFQSNIEGELINAIQNSTADAIVLNAGGYTHSSVALRDAVLETPIPVIEVHISNISAREAFRHTSLLSPVASGVVFGFGGEGYAIAVDACFRLLRRRQ